MHNPDKLFIPPLVIDNPRENKAMLLQTARLITQSRANRIREASDPHRVPINAPLYNPALGRR